MKETTWKIIKLVTYRIYVVKTIFMYMSEHASALQDRRWEILMLE